MNDRAGWTGGWDAPLAGNAGGGRIGVYFVTITSLGFATFRGVSGADGRLLARDKKHFVVATKPSTVWSGIGQPRAYVPATHTLYLVESVRESIDGLDEVCARELMSWNPRDGQPYRDRKATR